MLRHSLFNSERHSDVKVKFGERRISAHKSTLEPKSGYFRTAFSSKFPVATSDEIDLGDDDNPDAVESMLRFIYDLPFALDKDRYDLAFLMDVFEVADKYDVPGLGDDLCRTYPAPAYDDKFVLGIQRVCGPKAKNMADRSLENTLMSSCVKNVDTLYNNDLFKELMRKGELLDPRFLVLLIDEVHNNPRQDGTSRNFPAANEIFNRFKAGDLKLPPWLPPGVKDVALAQIKQFILPLNVTEYAEYVDTAPPSPRTECVFTRIEGHAQRTHDRLAACDNCREKSRLCLMRTSETERPMFVGLNEWSLFEDIGPLDAAFWLKIS